MIWIKLNKPKCIGFNQYEDKNYLTNTCRSGGLSFCVVITLKNQWQVEIVTGWCPKPPCDKSRDCGVKCWLFDTQYSAQTRGWNAVLWSNVKYASLLLTLCVTGPGLTNWHAVLTKRVLCGHPESRTIPHRTIPHQVRIYHFNSPWKTHIRKIFFSVHIRRRFGKCTKNTLSYMLKFIESPQGKCQIKCCTAGESQLPPGVDSRRTAYQQWHQHVLQRHCSLATKNYKPIITMVIRRANQFRPNKSSIQTDRNSIIGSKVHKGWVNPFICIVCCLKDTFLCFGCQEKLHNEKQRKVWMISQLVESWC